MRRISDDMFREMEYDLDKIVGIRVKDGEFYFLAWMENAPHYKIQKAMSENGYLLDRAGIMFDGNLYDAITTCDGYNNMYLLYNTDDEGDVTDEAAAQFEDAYDMFLSLIKCYERNGSSDVDDHDIIMLSKDELSSFCDILRDGDYIFIVEDM